MMNWCDFILILVFVFNNMYCVFVGLKFGPHKFVGVFVGLTIGVN